MGVFERLPCVAALVVLTAHCQISQSCTGARMRSRPGLRGPWQRGCFSPRTQTVGCPTLSAITQKGGELERALVIYALLLPAVLIFTW